VIVDQLDAYFAHRPVTIAPPYGSEAIEAFPGIANAGILR
jgi:hypothetical protein